MNLLYLIDTSAFVHRAYHALPKLTHPDTGAPVGAVMGFTQQLRKIIRRHRPTHIASVGDGGRHRRVAMLPEYKANRGEGNSEIACQFKPCDRAAEAFGITNVRVKGEEADDVIATLARRAAAQGFTVHIVSGDKDLMQLVGGKVFVLDVFNDKLYGSGEVEAKLGVPPHLVADYLAIVGDASDNIPGADGVGPKTAAVLLKRFGSLEAVLLGLANPTAVKNYRERKLLDPVVRTQVRLARKLVALHDVELELDLDDLAHPGAYDDERVLAFCDEMKFVTLANTIRGVDEPMAIEMPEGF